MVTSISVDLCALLVMIATDRHHRRHCGRMDAGPLSILLAIPSQQQKEVNSRCHLPKLGKKPLIDGLEEARHDVERFAE